MTELLFLQNTNQFETACKILTQDEDENGYFVILDRSIFYPQGGGQPADQGFLTVAGVEYKVKKSQYDVKGLKHYLTTPIADSVNEAVLKIDGELRTLHAAYHSAGHWLTQILTERLNLSLNPIKGHHFPSEAYIELEIKSNLEDDLMLKLQQEIEKDRHKNLEISAFEVEPDSVELQEAFLPLNFKIPQDKPLRLTQISSYLALPCGGTHVKNLNQIPDFTVLEFQQKKGNLKLKYRL